MPDLPGLHDDVYFGATDAALPDWRGLPESETDDDAPLTVEQRKALVGMLGFDPHEPDAEDSSDVALYAELTRFCQSGPNAGKPGVCPEHRDRKQGVLARTGKAGRAVRVAKVAEHRVLEKIKAKVPPKLQQGAALAAKAVFSTWIPAQAAAVAVAREVGGERHAKKVGRLLIAGDLIAAKIVPAGVGAVAGPAAASVAYMTPLASTAYLAYSTARHPVATYRAAKKAIGAAGGLAKSAAKKVGIRADVAGAPSSTGSPRIVGSPTPEHRVAAERWAAASPGLSPETAAAYTDHLSHALSVLPAGVGKDARESLQHGGVRFHPDLKALRGEAQKLGGKSAGGVVGFAHDRGMGTDLHLDGGDDPRGTYVHELWHAADNGGFHSDDKGWQSAYKKDILKGKHLLSRYAMTNPSEGFAEYGRGLAERGIDYMKSHFPNCWAHLEKKGLV